MGKKTTGLTMKNGVEYESTKSTVKLVNNFISADEAFGKLIMAEFLQQLSQLAVYSPGIAH